MNGTGPGTTEAILSIVNSEDVKEGQIRGLGIDADVEEFM